MAVGRLMTGEEAREAARTPVGAVAQEARSRRGEEVVAGGQRLERVEMVEMVEMAVVEKLQVAEVVRLIPVS